MSETLVLLSALWALVLSSDSVSGPLVLGRLFYLSMVEKRFFGTVYVSIGNEREKDEAVVSENGLRSLPVD